MLCERIVIPRNGRLFQSCSDERILTIQQFANVLSELFGTLFFDDKENQKANYCRIDFFSENPRWIRLYPSSRKLEFVVAFFIPKQYLSRLIDSANELGLRAEKGSQPESQDTDRFRLYIPDQYNLNVKDFKNLIKRLSDFYKSIV